MLDDDTVREWHDLFATSGVEGLSRFEFGGGASFLSEAQEAQLKAWIVEALPRTTRVIGAFIRREFDVEYESHSGSIKLLHRLGLEYHKLELIGRNLDESKQEAFTAAYENLLNSLGPDEAVLFVDAVHPTHAARPVGCWTTKRKKRAIEQKEWTSAPQYSRRDRFGNRSDADDRGRKPGRSHRRAL